MAETVSVALPVLNGGERLREVLAAVRAQRVDATVELVVVDSGSSDRSVDVAREFGAAVIQIAAATFNHGGTRNLLMQRTAGAHVAFLTQDALPADDGWLAALLSGFELAEDIALVTGPQRPLPDASPMVRRELSELFGRFGSTPRVDRGPAELGPATFFSSANGAVARRAWERVPFRTVAYGEDQALAVDMLAAGFAKAFMPDAAVEHSHEYAGLDGFRRVFDDFRVLHELFGLREPLSPRSIAARIRNDVAREDAATLPALRYHAQRALGRSLGTNADRLPRALRRWCSREGHAALT